MSEDINTLICSICGQFIESRILSAGPLGDGHINDTYLVTAEDDKYVLQRIKDIADTAKCEYNYGLYADIFAHNGFYYPVWLKNKAGKHFFTDETGCNWRIYRYIDGDIICPPLKNEQLFFAGQGLKKLHVLLQKITANPKPVYPYLHDLKHYYDEYCKIKNGNDLCTENIDPAIENIINTGIDKMLNISIDKTAVVHGDTKLANILFKDNKVTGFIDFDTIMNGSLLEDVADCIRSCCIDNGTLNREKSDALVKGYDIAQKEIKQLPDVFNKICFELGLRYYTDAISKHKLFKEKYPGFHLDRAKSLFSVKY